MINIESLSEYAQAKSTDPTHEAIARKAILQAQVLGYNEVASNFGDEKPVDIGIFRVFPTVATIDWVSPQKGLEIKVGDKYLDFHLTKKGDVSHKTANEGYAQIAEYLKTKPDIAFMLGVTYRIMALSGERNQGFKTEEIDLPEPVMATATEYWQTLMPELKPRHFQTAYVIWQDREEFINRFRGPQPRE